MRGAVMVPGGKTILALLSTALNDTVSRIVPVLSQGVGVTLTRGDVYYVVTEYGIAYLYGKNIRERAMDLISITHPKFRTWLLEEVKKKDSNLQRSSIYFRKRWRVPGKAGGLADHSDRALHLSATSQDQR